MRLIASMAPRGAPCAALVALFVGAAPVVAQPIVASKHGDPAPAELAEPVKATMATGGARAQIGEATLTFWWVKTAPLADGAAAPPSWKSVAEGSLIGAVQVAASARDIRGRTIKPGVYTLRYAIQPADGDHLGVSTFRDYLLLSPAADDRDPAPTGHDGTIKMSKNTVGGSHPTPWMLDPPVADGAALTTGTNDMGFTYVVFEVPSPGGALRFGLVLIGKVEA
jgi:hypothetical protein